MKVILTLALIFSTIILNSCGRSNENHFDSNMNEKAAKDDSFGMNGFISSSAAINKDTSRKFIRTADLKFRVKDVRNASIELENITAAFDGFVTYTHLSSNIDHTELTPVSADSSLETIFYNVTNDIVIRVPNISLDSALRKMAIHIDYLDYRTIKAQDVTRSLISNKMTEKRNENHSERLTEAIDNRGKKLKETTTAEENLYRTQEHIDKTQLSTLEILDQIDFSTINLHIYQRLTVKCDLIENYKNTDVYQPSLFSQIIESILKGWDVLKKIIVGLIRIWPIILLGLTGWIIYIKKIKK